MKETFNFNVNLYESIISNNPIQFSQIDFLKSLKKELKTYEIIKQIRQEKDKKKKTELKAKLPVITFNGNFSPTKKASDFLSHTGLMITDFDGFNSPEEMSKERQRIEKDKYTLLLFTSPSGNGFKALIKIPKTTPDGHKEYFEIYRKHINSKQWDNTSKNINRLCFLSYDPNYYFNQNSQVFKKPIHVKKTIKFYRSLIANRAYNKWEYFNKIAILVGGFSASNSLDCNELTALNELIEGSKENTNVADQVKSQQQITNGFNYGKGKPIIPDTDYSNKELDKANKITPPKVKDKFIYFRVGNDYFKKIQVPNNKGGLIEKIISTKRQTIVDDHSVKLLKKIKKYDAGVNVPSYINYQEEIAKCYNWFRPFEHNLISGNFKTIQKLFNHIFGDQIEMGYDYIKLLYSKPKQNVPVLVLVSKENHTGKTTFIDFLNIVFGLNMVIIGTSDIEGNFNQHYITKHIIAIDESDLHKENTTAKIKQMATQKFSMKKGKFQDETVIDFFGRLIILSNNELSFINIKEDDVRYWIRKVPVLKDFDPNFLDNLKKEIPAFMFFINDREMSYPKAKSRSWFAEEDFITEWSLNAKAENKSELYFDLYERLQNYFLNTDNDLKARALDIKDMFYKKDTRKSLKWIAKCLRDEFLIDSKTERSYESKIVGKFFTIEKSYFGDFNKNEENDNFF